MTEKVFDRETLLDLTVNVIPLGILALFFLAFIVANPFGFDSVISGIQLAVVGVSGLLLAVLTYYSGAAVSKAEKRDAALRESDDAELEADDDDPEADDAELEADDDDPEADDDA